MLRVTKQQRPCGICRNCVRLKLLHLSLQNNFNIPHTVYVLCQYSELQMFVDVSLHTSVRIFVYIKEPSSNELLVFSSSGYGLRLEGW